MSKFEDDYLDNHYMHQSNWLRAAFKNEKGIISRIVGDL
ncbi:hypothetical protein AEQU3_02295 [Aequorivita antarctica]|nr:hypothetical protein AEQU3_02295 [Aequorivita antarctica]